MLSFSPIHGVSYLIILSLLGTAFAGRYHPYSSETPQCKSSVEYTTITPCTTITASARTTTITVTPGGTDYRVKGQAYKISEHKSSWFSASTLIDYKTTTSTSTPTPTPHSTPSPHPTPTPHPSPSYDSIPQGSDISCSPAITSTLTASSTRIDVVTPLVSTTTIISDDATPIEQPPIPDTRPDIVESPIGPPPNPTAISVPFPIDSPQNNPPVPGFSSPDFSLGGAPKPPDGYSLAQPAVAPGPTPAPGVSSPGGPPVAPGDSPPMGADAPGVYTPGAAPQPGGPTGIVSPQGTASGLAPAQFTGAADRRMVGVGQSMLVGLAGLLLARL